MENKILVLGLLILSVVLVLGCTGTPNQENNVQMANPASVYCEQHNGTLEIRTDATGGQVGYCKFAGGSECEEWAYYRGNCTPGVVTPGIATSTKSDISIENFAFNPSVTTVRTGTTVIWTNYDNSQHKIVSDDGLFESGYMSHGETFIYTFTDAGTYNYHCGIHPSMTGKVIAEGESTAIGSGSTPLGTG